MISTSFEPEGAFNSPQNFRQQRWQQPPLTAIDVG